MDALQSIAACTQLRVLRLETRGSWTPADKAFESMMQLTRLTELKDLTMIVTVKKNRHKLYMVRLLALFEYIGLHFANCLLLSCVAADQIQRCTAPSSTPGQ